MSTVGTHGDENDGSLCPECEKRLAESEVAWKTRRQIDGEKCCTVAIKATNPDFIVGDA
jgi:hypothetical protein